ncbi:MAG: hypothetical protein K9J28_09115 [Sulfuritalea sp.]|nr:hypothetical protein [Sulfuritalea sp.]
MLFISLISPQVSTAQGLTPLKKTWKISNDKKIFQLTLINAYPEEMIYELNAEDKQTRELQTDVKFTAREGRIAAKRQRKVLVLVPVKEALREVRICLRFPELDDDLRVRVCGDYTFIRHSAGQR